MSFPGTAARIVLMLWAFAVCTPAPAAPTVVRRINYQGWTNAFLLTNGRLDVILVPSLGRVMAFQLAGQPETNVLWNNPALRGKPFPFPAPYPAHPKDWPNFGGDKTWPAPQDSWPQVQRQPGNWPPDLTLDAGPYTISRVRDGLRLTGPVSPYWGMRCVREFRLPPGSGTLRVRETFEKITSAAQGMPVGLWNIAQARPNVTAFFPVNPHSRFARGFSVLQGDKNGANWHVQDGLLTVTHHNELSNKAGVDAVQGWVAGVYNGSLLFAERAHIQHGAAYADGGTPLQVYNAGGHRWLLRTGNARAAHAITSGAAADAHPHMDAAPSAPHPANAVRGPKAGQRGNGPPLAKTRPVMGPESRRWRAHCFPRWSLPRRSSGSRCHWTRRSGLDWSCQTCRRVLVGSAAGRAGDAAGLLQRPFPSLLCPCRTRPPSLLLRLAARLCPVGLSGEDAGQSGPCPARRRCFALSRAWQRWWTLGARPL